MVKVVMAIMVGEISMVKNFNLFLMFVIISCIALLLSCATKTNEDSPEASYSTVTEMQADIDVPGFFGVWSLDKVVLRSKMYSDDITKNGDVIPFDVEDYLGYEVEYSSEYFRLGEEKYNNPQYNLSTVTVDEYEAGGKFRLTAGYPSVQEFIENGGIKVDRMDDYGYIGELPLECLRIRFEEDYFIPVGTQCIILNDDTMLIGLWGKIIIAHRIENEEP